MDIRAIGRSLSASHILEGSVRKAADVVRITAQLIDAETGAHLWSETYQRKIGDIFAIQDEIAQTVSREVRLRMGADPAEPQKTLHTVYVSERLMDPEEFKLIVQAISNAKG